LSASVDRLLSENAELKAKVSELQSRAAKNDVDAAKICLMRDGTAVSIVFDDLLSDSGMLDAANLLCEKLLSEKSANGSALCGIFRKAENGYDAIIAARGAVSAKSYFDDMKSALDAKGGGDSKMVRGRIKADQKDVCGFFLANSIAL